MLSTQQRRVGFHSSSVPSRGAARSCCPRARSDRLVREGSATTERSMPYFQRGTVNPDVRRRPRRHAACRSSRRATSPADSSRATTACRTPRRSAASNNSVVVISEPASTPSVRRSPARPCRSAAASPIANGPALTVPSCISTCSSTPPSSGLTIQLKPRSVTAGGSPAGSLVRCSASNIPSSSFFTSSSVHAAGVVLEPGDALGRRVLPSPHPHININHSFPARPIASPIHLSSSAGASPATRSRLRRRPRS